MALGTERGPAVPPLREGSDVVGWLASASDGVRAVFGAIGAWYLRQPLVRFISASLLRRILFSNLVGFFILLSGIFYFSQYHAWLIEAKRESLRTQGEIIAAAIAANATADTERIVLDPDKLPEAGDSLIPFRDDAFTALELSIRPERVTPVLKRLIQPTHNRARIYGRDGTLIVDTAALLSRGQIANRRKEGTRTKNFWTRLTYWLIDKDLPVYREIGSAKGTVLPEVRMALSGSTTPMLLLDEKGQQIVSMAVPIRRMRTVQGVLLLSTKPGEIDDILMEEKLNILALAVVALIGTIVTSLLLARTVAGPMRRLSAAAEQVSRNITARHDLPTLSGRNDEVGQMASAFRAMTAALYRRSEASEKFAADVAHELKNPLTAARSTAEALAYAKTEEQRQQLIQQIQHELKRLNRLISDVSNASRLEAELARQQLEPVDARRVLSSVTDIFRDILTCESRRILLDVGPEPFEGAYVVKGDEGRLGQVITNLIDNAVSFSPERGVVTVQARRREDRVEILVEDEGCGIPEDRLEMIFDRFYTDRPHSDSQSGKNSGLGLSISREIVRSHGGEIWAENRMSGGVRCGARLVVSLPAACAAPRPTGAALARRG